MVRQHHCLNGHESGQSPGDSEGQGSLECYSPWGHKELDMTQTEQKHISMLKYYYKNNEISMSIYYVLITGANIYSIKFLKPFYK